MSDLVGNPNCWFSHAQAHFLSLYVFCYKELDWWPHLCDSVNNVNTILHIDFTILCF